ncbi:MAG: hypothetical protein M1544_03780 [Candidatus Marsarchaeota archaeon]|nr:hypothetical protein [Candidatus Marsarchaeota archaeon]
MEKQKDGNCSFGHILELAKGNRDAYEILAQVSNSKYGNSAINGIAKLNLGPETILEIYKHGSDSKIDKFSEVMGFYSIFNQGELDALRLLCTDSKGIDARSLLLLTTIAVLESLDNDRNAIEVMNQIIYDVSLDGARGSELYEYFEEIFVGYIGNIVLANLMAGTNPYRDLEAFGTPDQAINKLPDLINEYVGKSISKIKRE